MAILTTSQDSLVTVVSTTLPREILSFAEYRYHFCRLSWLLKKSNVAKSVSLIKKTTKQFAWSLGCGLDRFELVLHRYEDLQVQIFDNLSLLIPEHRIVVESGGGIDLDNVITLPWRLID